MKSDTDMMMIAASAACGSAREHRRQPQQRDEHERDAEHAGRARVRPPPLERDMLPAIGMPPVNAAPKSAAPSAISS